MRRSLRRSALILGFIVATAPSTFALQGSVSRGPIAEPRNAELEEEAYHNLEVARFYIKKKRWVGARTRLQEIVANHPNFSEIAEVYFLLGKVYTRTNELELALELYTRVVEEFPQSEYAEKARSQIRKLSHVKEKKRKAKQRHQEKEARYVHTCGGIGRV